MDKKKITLSVALAVYNEEQNIRRCLSSVSGFADEIVIVDGGSTDRTLDIAREYKVRIIQTDNPRMFHTNKQKSLEACRGVWILQLDADEVITENLKSEIISVIGGRSGRFDAFFIPRKNYFAGHWLRKGGQYPDFVIRLLKSGKAHFPQKSVHEQIAVNGEVGYLTNPILHYSYRSIDEYWRKSDTYTSFTAQQLKDSHIPVNLQTFFSFNVLNPLGIFLSIFIRHKGFMDGYYGYLFALFSALHYPIAYRKYVERIKS